MELRPTATKCHLSYGITLCYLPPDTSEHTPPLPKPDRSVLVLPIPEEWEAELAFLYFFSYRACGPRCVCYSCPLYFQ